MLGGDVNVYVRMHECEVICVGVLICDFVCEG